MNDVNYYVISGSVDESRMEPDSEVLVWVDGHTYRAYHTDENGFMMYLKKEAVSSTAALEVYLVSGNGCTQMLATELALT